MAAPQATRAAIARGFTPHSTMVSYSQLKCSPTLDGDNVFFVKFSDLKEKPGDTLQEACTFLDIEYTETMLHHPYKRNTSFYSENEDTEKFIGGNRETAMLIVYHSMGLIPLAVLKRFFDVFRPNKQIGVVPLTFGSLRYERGILNETDARLSFLRDSIEP